MAWEWVAPVCTASVGVAGIVGAVWTAARGRQHAENVAEQKNAHDRALAYEQRQQQRRAEAYVELLTMVERVGMWASMVQPAIDFGQQTPDLPDLQTQAKAIAITKAYASSAALEQYKAWRGAVDEIGKAAHLIAMSRSRSSDHFDHGEIWLKLEQNLRPAEVTAREELAATLSRELAQLQRVEASIALTWKIEPGSLESQSSRRWHRWLRRSSHP